METPQTSTDRAREPVDNYEDVSADAPAAPASDLTAEHGTTRGYKKETRLGIEHCDPCRKAMADYFTEYRKANARYADHNRGRAKARSRALRKLAERHHAEFMSLLADELST